MTAFDHVVLLLSFVYALALTHLLSRVGAIIAERDRVNWAGSGLMWLAMANGALNLVVNWIALLWYRNQTDWTLLDVVTQLSMAIVLYFWCYLTVPDVRDEGTVELAAHFWKQRRALYAVALAVCAVAFVDNLEYLKTPSASTVLLSNAIDLALVVPVLAAFLTPARWVQWVCGLGVLILCLSVFVAYFWKLA
jgi:hypothetical protein